MRFQCPFCNYVISVPDEYMGYRVSCTSCDKSINIPSTPFEMGCVIGDFVIQTKLGAGAIGAVYKAFQISLERIVALKILSNEHITPKGLIEFQREARAAAKLIHVNLVQSYAVGEDNGICYMAMTYINGETLKSRIRRGGPIACDEALHIIQQVAEALHYAWTESHLIHRDVKPDNIMLSENGIVKLTDLGLAMQQADWRKDMDISGSPSYMSPEQFSGEKLDTRSDIYSLGVTLYQMLSGELPFDAETIRSIAKQHFEVPVPDIHKKVPSLPPDVGKLIKKMMAKVPEKRFRDMEALLEEIWKIRQKTAPNQELVPDVHTISLRRLDYEIQLQKPAAENPPSPAQTKPEPAAAPPVDNRSSRITFLLILLGLVCGLSISFNIYQKHSSKQIVQESLVPEETAEIYEHIIDFEKLALDPSLSEDELERTASTIIAKVNSDKSMHPAIKSAIHSYVLTLLRSREAQREKALIDQQKKQILNLTMSLEEKQKELEFLKNNQAELETRAKSVADLSAKVEVLQKEVETLRNELNVANIHIAEHSVLVIDMINSTLFAYWENARFEECEQWLQQMKKKHVHLSAHIDILCHYNHYLQIALKKIQGLNRELAGELLSIGTVSHFDNGVVHYFSTNGELLKRSWHDLSVEDLWLIITYRKRARVEDGAEQAAGTEQLVTEEELPLFKAVIDIFTGNCTAVYKAIEEQTLPAENVESLKKLADTRAELTAKLLMMLCEYGKISAKGVYALYQKNCQGAPHYYEWLKKFQPYFEKKDAGKTLDKSPAL